MASVGTAVFTAVGQFGGLIRDANRTEAALRGVGDAGDAAGRAIPASGGQAGDGLRRMGSGAVSAGKSISGAGATLTKKLTLPLVGMGAVAVKQFASFEMAIVAAGQKSGATSKELEQMKKVALDMGDSTMFSAQDAATALDTLAASGMTANQSMQALPGVMLAAQASGEDLGLTADVISKSINAFGLSAKDAGHIADVFATASNTTALDMQGLSDAMANVGEVGSRYGQNMEGVVAWTGRLVDMGVPAAAAGTAIRQSLTSLAAPTKKAAGIIKDLGLKVRDSNGNMLQSPDLLKNVQNALSNTNPKFRAMAKETGLTGQALKDYALKNMFGVEGAKAFALAISSGKPVMLDATKNADQLKKMQDGLAKTMGQKAAAAWIKNHTHMGKFKADGADAVKANQALMKSSDGVSKKVGEQMGATTAAKIDQFWGSLQTLAITLVGSVAPALTKAITKATDFIAKINEFGNAHPQLQKIAVGVGVVLAALGPVLFIVGKVVTAFGRMAQAAGLAIRGVSAAARGVGAAARGAGRGVSFLFGRGPQGQASRFARSFDSIRLRAGQMGNAFKSAGRSVGSAVARFASATARIATSAAQAAARTAAAGARVVATWVMMAARATANAARMALAWVVGVIRQAATAAAAMAVTAARVVAGWVLMGVQSMIQAARMALAWLIAMGPIALVIAAVIAAVVLIILNWGKVVAFLTAAWNIIKAAAIAVWNSLVTFFQTVMTAITGALVAAWNGVMVALSAVWTAIKAVAMALWNGLMLYFQTWWLVVRTVFTTAVAVISAVLSAAWNLIRSVAIAVWNALKSGVVAIWNGLSAAVTAGVNALKAFLSAAWNMIKSTASAVWNALRSAVLATWNALKAGVTAGVNALRSFLSGAWNGIRNTASAVWNALKAAVVSIVNRMKGAVTGTVNALKSAITGAFNAAKSSAVSIVNGIKSAVTGAVNEMKRIWDSVWNGLGGAVSGALSSVKGIVDGFIGPIAGAIGKITGPLNAIKGVAGKVGGWLGFNKGGLVPGTGNRDTVPTVLTPGEFVLNKDAVARAGVGFLQRYNAGMGGSQIMAGASKTDLVRSANSRASQQRRDSIKHSTPFTPLSRVSLAERARTQPQLARSTSVVVAPVLVGAGMAATGSTTRAGDTYQIEVNNPREERASDSIQAALTRSAQLGIIGGRRSS